MGKYKTCRKTDISSKKSVQIYSNKNKSSNESIRLLTSENKVAELRRTNMDVTFEESASAVPVFQFVPSGFMASSSQALDARTGYADALKKNLSFDDFIKIDRTTSTNASIVELKTIQKEDDKSTQLVDKDTSISEISSSAQTIVPPNLKSTPSDEEILNCKSDAFSNYLTSAMRDGFNFGSLVSTNCDIHSKLICEDGVSPIDDSRTAKLADGIKKPKSEVDIKDEAQRMTDGACRFLNSECLVKRHVRSLSETSALNVDINVNNKASDEALIRTYSDGTRVEDSLKLLTEKTCLEDVEEVVPSRRRYSDVTRSGLDQMIEINTNSNEFQTIPLDKYLSTIQTESAPTRSVYASLFEQKTLFPIQFESDELNDKLIDHKILKKSNIFTGNAHPSLVKNTDKEISQPTYLIHNEHKGETENGYEFASGEIMFNQDIKKDSFILTRNKGVVSTNFKDSKKRQIIGDIRKKTSKKVSKPSKQRTHLRRNSTRSSTVLNLSNLEKSENTTTNFGQSVSLSHLRRNSSPSSKILNLNNLEKSENATTKFGQSISLSHLRKNSTRSSAVLNLLNLEKTENTTTNFGLSVSPELNSKNCQQPVKKTMSNLITICKDFEKICSPNSGSLTKHKSNSFESALENSKEDAVSFFDNVLKFLRLKTLKTNNCISKFTNNHLLNNIGWKQQESMENILNNRRKLTPVVTSNNNYETSNKHRTQYLDAGQFFGFINCQADSKWYSLLKELEPCVPLSQLLLPPTEIPNFCQPMHLHSIYTKVGKVVFSTKLEHTLSEGKFGTFVGILDNGNPVTVRQLSSFAGFKDITAMSLSSRHSLEHKNLTKLYASHINSRDITLTLVYELCEYSLPEYLKMRRSSPTRTMAPPMVFRKLLVIDLLEGIRYLHQMKVVHGFLKPSNIMVTIEDRLKLADYHLCNISPLTWGIRLEDSKPKPIGSSISNYCWRPTELINAKNESEAQTCLTAASDIQMCGMLVFYILTDGRHPFGSTDLSCQENIGLGTPCMGPHTEDFESRDLVCRMIKASPGERPTMGEVLRHPYFWDKEKRFEFLLQVGKKINFYTRLNREVEDFRRSCIEARNWTSHMNRDLMKFISMCTNKSFRNDFSDLLEFAVALQKFFPAMPQYLKNTVQHPTHFILLKFPALFMSVYDVIRSSPLLISQMGLHLYFY